MTEPGAIRRVLVVRLSAIGDIVLTTPVLSELHRALPDARIDYCTKAPFAPLVASNPAVSSVVTPESLTPGASYELVVDLQNNRRSRALVRKLRVGKVTRYHKRNWKKLFLVQFKINVSDGYQSVVERYGEALDGLAVLAPKVTAPCSLYPSPEDRAFAADVLGADGPVLAVCFGANHFTKRYPLERFARIIEIVTSETPARVLLLGGKEDEPEAKKLIAMLPDTVRSRVLSLAGKASLMQSAALLSRVDAVLTNDTGLMHIASAFGKKLFVIFGSSVKEFGFMPWGTEYELFETPGLSCRPCSHIGRSKCPKRHFRCMMEIAPEPIAARIVETLNKNSA
ncbi:glycosyl transferase family 9 [Chlorobaculum parvum NCIB 8327]|uniref:Glycosyl transferase family 9 n=1 Tax=Chlorobaculum parvum (strain DSM 263 / NCIMB 8327) TaxID=517417 RepID=B3QRL3_CHLP8|nr:glycosyl transferase family 9 [Chlorobaculum parvum NCIB 8327]